jgi:endonuclease/exonuclease/phosphatase (EEP) superfamily protein YafD
VRRSAAQFEAPGNLAAAFCRSSLAVIRPNSAVSSTAQVVLGLLLLTLGFLATLATLLGFFGSNWWAFDALANFRAQYAVLLLVVAALYGAILARGAAVVFLLVGLINVWMILPLYLQSPAEARGGETLTVASLNVQAANPERARVLRWVEDSGADIVFLLESSEPWEQAIRSAGSGLSYTIQSSLPEGRRFGITVLAKRDVIADVVTLGQGTDPVVRVGTDLDGRPLALFAAHPPPATSEEGAAQRDVLLELLAVLVSQEVDPVVVIGDLNATPWSHAFRRLQGDGDLVNSLEGYGLQPTWPADLPFGLTIPIDHMLHTSELTTTERAVGPSLGSDHRPLLVTVARAAA